MFELANVHDSAYQLQVDNHLYGVYQKRLPAFILLADSLETYFAKTCLSNDNTRVRVSENHCLTHVKSLVAEKFKFFGR